MEVVGEAATAVVDDSPDVTVDVTVDVTLCRVSIQ